MTGRGSRQVPSLRIVFRKDPGTGRMHLIGDNHAWADQVRRFLEALEARGLSVNTISAYAYDIVILSRWLDARERKLEVIEECDLLDFIRSQRDAGVASSTINRRLTTAEALYRFITGDRIPRRKAVAAAVPNRRGRGYDRLGVRYLGPSARRALRVKEPKKLIDPMTADQVKALFAAFHRYRDLAIVYLMLFCGLRSCEVLAIQLDDIDTENGVLRVRGKGDKQRVVPLARTVSRAIAAFLRLERPRHCLAQHLFVVLKGARRGCPMTRAGLRSLFRGRRRNPVLNNANPHNLRHTFGTQMARAGMRLPALKKLMGHADANTTFRYINLSLGDIAEAFHDACEKIGERYET